MKINWEKSIGIEKSMGYERGAAAVGGEWRYGHGAMGKMEIKKSRKIMP